MKRIIEVRAPEYRAGWMEIIVPAEIPGDAVHQHIMAGHPWPEVVSVRSGERTFIKPSTIVALRVR